MLFGCADKSVVDGGAVQGVEVAAREYKPPAALPGALDGSVNGMELPLLAGGNAKFSDLIGQKKVVLVNFWATWCGPCRREIPDLVALQKQFKDKGVEIIGLTIEHPQMDHARVEAFTQQFAINYRVGFAPQQMFMHFNNANAGGPRAPIPQTFIFDKNGKLLDSLKGFRPDFRVWAESALNYALKAS